MSFQSPEISVGSARRAALNLLRRSSALVLVFFMTGLMSGAIFSQDAPDPAGDEPVVKEKPKPVDPVTEPAPKTAPTKTAPLKRTAPRRKAPRRKTKPRQDGIADEFPAYPEKLVPGTKGSDNIVLPHLKGGKAPEPPRKVTPTPPTPSKTPPAVKTKPKDDGPGFWASLIDRIRNDQKFINILVLAILVAIFVIYRIRAGRSVRRNF